MILLQETAAYAYSTGHFAYDLGIGAAVALLGASKVVELAKSVGLIPDKNGNGGEDGYSSVKSVGRLSVDSMKNLLRHQINDALTPIAAKLVYNSDQQILLLTKLVTIMEERKK